MTTKTDMTEVCSAKPIALSIGRRIMATALFLILIMASSLVTSNARAEVQEIQLEWIQQFGFESPAADYAFSVDSIGDAYVAGWTDGTLPGQTSSGGTDAFVRKYDGSGNVIWTRQFGSTANDHALAVSADCSGAYVAGRTYGALTGQTPAGDADIFVCKYDGEGNMVWTTQFGSIANDGAYGISVDTSGVYITGYTLGALPGQMSAGGSDAFVRKYDSSGNAIWTRQFGTSTGEWSNEISIFASEVYITGPTYGVLPGQSSAGDFDSFVRKYDVNGNIAWTSQFGSISTDYTYGISADPSGVYVAGRTNGALPGQTSAGGWDEFVRKYDGYGNVVWTSQSGTSSLDGANAISADGSGVYVVGETQGALSGQTSSGGTDAFVQKYDGDGNVIWTRQFGSPSTDYPNSVSVDGCDVYVTGCTDGALPGQSGSGSWDAFVRKYDGFGNVVWTRQFGFVLPAADYAFSVDFAGNAYIAGWTNGALSGEMNAGGADAFVRKYDSGGDVVWTKQFGSSADDHALAVSADSSGVYVTGRTYGSLSGQQPAGDADIFVRKYDGDGNVVWTKQLGTTANDGAYGIFVDASGVYVTGYTHGALPGQTNAGGCDAFVQKYGGDGDIIWTRQFGTSAYDWSNEISVIASEVYITGPTYGVLPGQSSAGDYDAFVRKYDGNGNVIWTRQFGTPFLDYSYGISADTTGAFVAGRTYGTFPGQTSAGGCDSFVRKYDVNGNVVWTSQSGTSSLDGANAVAVGSSGVYVVGETQGTLNGQTSSGGTDAFVQKYDGNGNIIWTKQLGSPSTDYPNSVSVDGHDVYVVGCTDGALPGQTSSGGWDAFVVKFGENAPPAITSFTASPGTILEGSPTVLEVAAVDPNGDSLTYLFDFEDDGVFDTAGSTSTVTHVYPEDGVFSVRVRVSDGALSVEATTTVCVLNDAPVVTITSPVSGSVVAMGAPVSTAGEFSDSGIEDTHTAAWSFDTTTIAGTVTETGGSGSVQDTFTFSSAGVYAITLTVCDDEGGVGTANTVGDLVAYVVVYDPNAGFVTGGGWINSPLGAYALDPALSGKATFGFVSKYQKGAKVPTGETEFQFRVAGLNYHSAAYEWLVVAGSRGQYKGTGTINGQGDYGFVLTVIDGNLPGGGGMDRFRIKIWDKTTDMIIYDNQMGEDDFADPTTVIGGGSIFIHK